MATDRAEKKQKVKTEIRSMFLISLDGLDPTKEAAQSLEITHDNPCPVSDGNDNVVVHRKLLRRRHVRKLQKERKAVSVSNTTRSSVTFGLQHCSFIDIKLPIHHHVHVASPDRPVRFPQGYRPTVSPIRPRMLHSILPDTNETLVMPPMSPIQSASMRDWEDYRHPALGVKRKLESSFL